MTHAVVIPDHIYYISAELKGLINHIMYVVILVELMIEVYVCLWDKVWLKYIVGLLESYVGQPEICIL